MINNNKRVRTGLEGANTANLIQQAVSETMDFIFKSISNFQLPFSTDGQPVISTPFGTIENGTRKSDSLPVTIHTYNTTNVPSLLWKNHIHKCKVLKLPGLVKVLDVIEFSPDKVYIVTERTTPLTSLDYNRINECSLKLGMYQVAQTLTVLHEQAKCLFGALSIGNIYVNTKGEWVLYGLELSTSFNDPAHFSSNLQVYNGVVRGYDNWELLGNVSTPVGVDAAQLYTVYSTLFQGNIPTSWKPTLAALAKGQQGSVQKFVAKLRDDNGNPLISIYDNLKEIYIKDPVEKVMMLSNIQQTISADDKPFKNPTPGFLENTLLPELTQCLQMISTTNQPTSNQVPFLGTIFHLTCSDSPIIADENVFQTQVKPIIFQSFNVADRQVRFLLLLHFANFTQKLSASEVADKIFPPFIQGLSDTDQTIRLQTLKNVSHLIGKITERQLNNDLLRVLAKTQVDKDIGIRTLTILIITKIAHKLNKSSNRSTILATAFTKSLKDPDLKPRLATLYGLETTLDLFDAETIAQRILTVIGPGLLDKNKQVRENAKKVFHMYWDKLEQESASFPDDDDSEDIPEEEFDRMMNDEEDGELINGFIQSVKLSTPTPTSTPADLVEPVQESDPWNAAFDDDVIADLDDSWDVDEPEEQSSNNTQVKSFGFKVPVKKSWNDELDDTPLEHNSLTKNTSSNSLKLKKEESKPSILSKKPVKRTSILSKSNKTSQQQHPRIASSIRTSHKNTSKVIAPTPAAEDDDVEDGWGDDW